MIIPLCNLDSLVFSTPTSIWTTTARRTTRRNNRATARKWRRQKPSQTSTSSPPTDVWRRTRSTTTSRRFATRRFVTTTGGPSWTRHSWKTSRSFRTASRLWKCSAMIEDWSLHYKQNEMLETDFKLVPPRKGCVVLVCGHRPKTKELLELLLLFLLLFFFTIWFISSLKEI